MANSVKDTSLVPPAERSVSVVFGPRRGCFHTENWASCPCHTLAIGERTLAMVIRHILHLQNIPISKTFQDILRFSCPLPSCLLNSDNTIQVVDERLHARGPLGRGRLSYWLLVSIEQPSKKWGVKYVFKVWKNFQIRNSFEPLPQMLIVGP